jgi:hypothetical protein
MENNVALMKSVRNQMMSIPAAERNADYESIYKSIQEYLRKYCQHRIVDDLIDLDPDRSMTIYYCEYCETLFQRSQLCQNVTDSETDDRPTYTWKQNNA